MRPEEGGIGTRSLREEDGPRPPGAGPGEPVAEAAGPACQDWGWAQATPFPGLWPTCSLPMLRLVSEKPLIRFLRRPLPCTCCLPALGTGTGRSMSARMVSGPGPRPFLPSLCITDPPASSDQQGLSLKNRGDVTYTLKTMQGAVSSFFAGQTSS